MFRRSANFSAVKLGAWSVAAVLVLGGCSGSGDEPGAEAATGGSGSSSSSGASASADGGLGGTASASASPTPTPTTPAAAYKPASAEGPAENVPLPVMPELAKQESKEGLEAFAEYWYALANYGYETGNPELVRAVSADSCLTCESYYRVIRKGYEGADWMVGGAIYVQDVSSNFVATPEGYFQATSLILQDEMNFYGPEGHQGTEPESSAPGAQLMEARYESGTGWYVVILETIEM